jgi:hypothetical protein
VGEKRGNGEAGECNCLDDKVIMKWVESNKVIMQFVESKDGIMIFTENRRTVMIFIESNKEKFVRK